VDPNTERAQDPGGEAAPVRRDGLAAMAVIVLTVVLIALVVSSLV